MLRKHCTRDGRKMLIAEMSDEHLQNTVKLKMANIAKLQRGLVEAPQINPYHARLYGMPKLDIDEAAEHSRQIIDSLYPYLSELYLRGLNDLAKPLRKLIGRSGQLTSGVGLLPSSNEEDVSGFDLGSFLDSFDMDSTIIIDSDQDNVNRKFEKIIKKERDMVGKIIGDI